MKQPIKEKWVKQQVVKMLKDRGAYYFYPVASGYMSIGVPDIVACVDGCFIGIECKAGKGKPTLLQLDNLKRIEASGGFSVVVNESNVNQLEELIKSWVNTVKTKT